MSKITITPIGTCRINTPLKRGATRYPIRLDYRRTYGFVHTSEEVLQQMRYRRGELVVPDELKPLLFRPGYCRESDEAVTDNGDLTIVEISSSKSCLIGDIAVQTNYVIRHFNDLLSLPNRAKRFWDLVTRGERAELHAFLSSPNLAHLCAPEGRELLSRMTFHKQNFDEVMADMTAITDLVGTDRLLFVTHVNARAADGELISSRDRLIRWVKLASERLGVRCFDPTELMLEMGQERAMEREGLDLTHFTNPFYDRWYSQVQRDYILPLAADSTFKYHDATTPEAAILTESIATAIEFDDFFEGTRQLFAALKSHPDYVPLQLLHGQVLARLGDYERASDVFSNHVDSAEMTAETRQSYMRVLLETGANDEALSVAMQMLTDEYENDEIYETAGIAAERLGLIGEALRYRKLAFRFNPSAFPAAISVLDHYREAGEQSQYQNWLHEVSDLVESKGTAFAARGIAEWALVHQEADTFSRAFATLARLDTSSLPRLIDEAGDAHMTDALADAAVDIGELPQMSDRVERALRKLAKKWAEEAAGLLSDDQIEKSTRLVAACLAVLPGNRNAIILQRELLGYLRVQMQERINDPTQVIELCERSRGLVFGQKGTALLYANALLQAKRWSEAQNVFSQLHEAEPDDINLKAKLAQVAAANDDFMEALRLYHELAALSEDKIGRYGLRVERFMATAEVSAIRHLRALTVQDRFDDAVALAELLKRLEMLQGRLSAELDRLHKSIRAYLRRQSDEDLDSAEALRLLKLMLQISPDEGPVLRRAALEAMKLGDFKQALTYWERLDRVVPDQPSTLANINRCQIFIKRQSRIRERAARIAA